MEIYGIFGDPVSHSLSPVMQNAAFRAAGIDACYIPFRVREEDLRDALLGARAMGISGLNLTIPLKEKALDIVSPDPLARAIGAVNTVVLPGLRGYNTDGYGALRTLQDAGARIKGAKVLLIGAGGAARAIAFTLWEDGASVDVVNRSPAKARDIAEKVGGRGFGLSALDDLVPGADIVVNATSIGMREGDGRIVGGGLHEGHIVFDVVYNRETELLRDAKEAGAVALDGVMMLVHQGARAFHIWTGREAPVSVMEYALRTALESALRGAPKK